MFNRDSVIAMIKPSSDWIKAAPVSAKTFSSKACAEYDAGTIVHFRIYAKLGTN